MAQEVMHFLYLFMSYNNREELRKHILRVGIFFNEENDKSTIIGKMGTVSVKVEYILMNLYRCTKLIYLSISYQSTFL